MKNNRINEEQLEAGLEEKARLAKESQASHHAENYDTKLTETVSHITVLYPGVNERTVRKAHNHLFSKKLINHKFAPVNDHPQGVCKDCNSTHVALMHAYLLGHTVV